MKLITVVGARPQFIKLAIVSKELRKTHNEVLVHTGQHFDSNMSDVFFNEMQIPCPDYNLSISGGSHGQMTGRMLIALEEVFHNEAPDACMVYGDTNSTLAAALAAVKLHIPVYHVEAGVRSGTLNSPEEVNRILTDRISTKLFAPTEVAVANLHDEGITNGVYLTGDPMYDAFLYFSSQVQDHIKVIDIKGNTINLPSNYYYLTCHREENSKSDALNEILSAADALDSPVIYPVHPRNYHIVKDIVCHNVIFIKPVGYLTSLRLLMGCEKVITDSGGLQREAFWAKKQCVTLLEKELWSETHIGNRNQLARNNSKDILDKLFAVMVVDDNYKPFGSGNASSLICEAL